MFAKRLYAKLFFACGLFIVLIAFYFQYYQSDTLKWSGKEVDENSIKHIYNPDSATLPTVSLTDGDRINVFPDSNSADSLALAYPIDLSVNTHHDVAIIDNVISKIIVLDSLFNVIRTYGDGKGKGPKQFSVSYSVYLDDDHVAEIADFRNHRFQSFYPDGRVFVHNLQVSGQIMQMTKDPKSEFIYILTRYSSNRIWRINPEWIVDVIYNESYTDTNQDVISATIQFENVIAVSLNSDILFAYRYKPLIIKIRNDKVISYIHYKPLYKLENRIVSGDNHGDGHQYVSMSAVCLDIAVDEHGFYVLTKSSLTGGRRVILRFDDVGRLIQKIILPIGSYNSFAVKDNFLYLLVNGSRAFPRCEKFVLPENNLISKYQMEW